MKTDPKSLVRWLALLGLGLAGLWFFSTDLPVTYGPSDEVPRVSARPPVLEASKDAAEEPRVIREPDTQGVIVGGVTLQLPGGGKEGVPALVHWCVSQEQVPDENLFRGAQVMALPENGTFVIEAGPPGTLWCAAEHVDGVTTVASVPLPVKAVHMEMEPAGKLAVDLPGNQDGFTLLLEEGTESASPRRVYRAEGRGGAIACGGIPLKWGSVRVTVLWEAGGRAMVDKPVPLIFRRWSHVTIDRASSTGVVFGRIVGESGEPIDGAGIFCHDVVAVGNGKNLTWDGSTQGDGMFRLTGLSVGARIGFVVRKEGFVAINEEVEMPIGGTLDLGDRVLGRGASIKGNVDDADAAKGPLRVVIRPLQAASDHVMVSARFAKPGADRRFAFSGVRTGKWIVALMRDPPIPMATSWGGRIVEVRHGDREVIVADLALTKRETCLLCLQSREGESLVGLKVIARGLDEPWIAYGTAGGDACAELDLGPGRFLVGLCQADGGPSEGPSLSWCGVLNAGERVCEVPGGTIGMTLPEGCASDRCSVTVVHAARGWPGADLPLSSEVWWVPRAAVAWSSKRLADGQYTVRITWRGQSRDLPVVVDLAHRRVEVPWPF